MARIEMQESATMICDVNSIEELLSINKIAQYE